jgi:hypothetical protein
MAPKKSTAKPKPAAKPKTAPKGRSAPKAEKVEASSEQPAAEAATKPKAGPKIFNSAMDVENQKLFLQVHLPEIEKLKEKLATANSNLRNAYKTAKAEGGFTKEDFEIAAQIKDAEREAKAKARIARQLVIARYMGKSLGAQLELFLEPDRTPASDLAYEEGRQDGLQNKAAKPDYAPSTEQYRRYMEGFHSVSEERITTGIKKTDGVHPAVKEDQERKAAEEAKIAAQKQSDEAEFEEVPEVVSQQAVTSGVPTSRAAFLAQQERERQAVVANAESVFLKRH